jgi:DNA-binding MarR family transcriptional regulator
MSTSSQFNRSLREWAENFMHRSMGSAVRFAKGEGLSMVQMSVLMRLHYHGGCGVSDIGAQLGVTSAAASQMIDRLAERGLVERTEDPHDRRAKQISLTEAGESLLLRSRQARDRWMESLARLVGPEEQAIVITAFGYLTEALRKLEAEA